MASMRRIVVLLTVVALMVGMSVAPVWAHNVTWLITQPVLAAPT